MNTLSEYSVIKKGTRVGGSWLSVTADTIKFPFGTLDASRTTNPCLNIKEN